MNPINSAKRLCYRLAYPFATLYWRILKPNTYGVKAMLTTPRDKIPHILLMRNTYGSDLWNLPGGGYRPSRENALLAIQREIKEEIGLVIDTFNEVGSYKTNTQGKQDTVTIFSAEIDNLKLKKELWSAEVGLLTWATVNDISTNTISTARVVRRAVEMISWESHDNIR